MQFLTLTDQIVSFVHGFYILQRNESIPPPHFFVLRMRESNTVCLMNKHLVFPEEKLCNTSTSISNFSQKRHVASLWDLYLAFCNATYKIFHK